MRRGAMRLHEKLRLKRRWRMTAGWGRKAVCEYQDLFEKEIGNKRAKWKGQRRDTMQAN